MRMHMTWARRSPAGAILVLPLAALAALLAACTAKEGTAVPPAGTGQGSGGRGFVDPGSGTGGQGSCFDPLGESNLLMPNGVPTGSTAPDGFVGTASFGLLPPQLGATVTPAVAPPAISGGTLRILHDGHTAVASDPDRDRVSVVDLTSGTVLASVALLAGDEPGRVVEDGAGRVHVSLRHGGALVTLAPPTFGIVARRPVCAAPRGLAYEAALDRVHVACADGQLVSFPAAGGDAVRTLHLDRDLRDVVVDGDTLLVSRFRSAQVLTLDADGHELQRLTPPSYRSSDTHGGSLFSAGVAWRMVEMPGGGAAMIHQRGMEDSVPTQPGGYGSRNPCDAIVHSAMTVMKSGMAMPSTPALVGMVLPTDMAVSADGKRVAVIASGNGSNASGPSLPPALPRVFVTDIDAATDPTTGCNPDGRHAPCVPSGFETGGAIGSGGSPGSSGGAVGTGGEGTGGGLGTGGFVAENSGGSAGTSSFGGAGGGVSGVAGAPSVVVGGGGTATGGAQVDTCASSRPEGGAPDVRGEPIAVAFDGTGRVVVQTREPSALFVVAGGAAGTASISLSSVSRADTGHAIFHGNAGGMIACASCHPEGTEDGRVWNFSCEGPRRTQSLGGGLAGTEPFHWNGELPAFPALMTGVFVGRMSGPALASDQVDGAFSWINRQPRVPVAPPSDPAAAARGRAIFQDSTRTACSTCHAGDKLTNNQTVDVGTGGLFQVPSLVGVSARPPFMHDGCARTLADRFTPTCGGGDRHGVTSTLSAAELADLIAYLETL